MKELQETLGPVGTVKFMQQIWGTGTIQKKNRNSRYKFGRDRYAVEKCR